MPTPHDEPQAPGPYAALLGLAESAATQPDPPALIRAIAGRLRAAVRFDLLGVLLHDAAQDVMRLTVCVSDDPRREYPETTVPPVGSPGGRAWLSQEPVLLPDLGTVTDWCPAMRAVWSQFGMRSAYYVPLTTARRRLGTVFFANRAPHPYQPDELELLRFAARQAAVAIDNALAAADVARLRDELRAERDRLRNLLEVTTAVTANLDLRGLLRATAAGLRRVVPVEYVSLALYDPGRHAWDLHALDFPSGKGLLRESLQVPFPPAPASLAFAARKSVHLDRPALDRMSADSSVARALAAEGIHHWFGVPLVGRD